MQTTRLDDVPGLPDLDFLKMDIQGGELQALEHGQARLAQCAMIHLEVSFVPLYEGQPSFGEIDVWMRAHGFIPHRFTEVKRWSDLALPTKDNDVRARRSTVLLEADIVYARDPEGESATLGPAAAQEERRCSRTRATRVSTWRATSLVRAGAGGLRCSEGIVCSATLKLRSTPKR